MKIKILSTVQKKLTAFVFFFWITSILTESLDGQVDRLQRPMGAEVDGDSGKLICQFLSTLVNQ